MNLGNGKIMPNMVCPECGAIHTLVEYFEERGRNIWECTECKSHNEIRRKGAKSRYFQVYNWSTSRWVKYDRDLCRIVGIRKKEGPYPGIPRYRPSKETKG
jgi:transposase-like protein